jgi:hypothetical protein
MTRHADPPEFSRRCALDGAATGPHLTYAGSGNFHVPLPGGPRRIVAVPLGVG